MAKKGRTTPARRGPFAMICGLHPRLAAARRFCSARKVARLLFLLFPAHAPRATWNLIASAIFALGLALFSWRFFTTPFQDLAWDWGWTHNVHLVFHEAGHAIPMMVGAPHTLMVFMGSGLQVLFPLILAGAFYFKNRDAYGAAICLWWAGHAALDVAPYIADARALELPLLGGGTGREVEGHDWEYLLGEWNALHLDTRIGARVALAGRVTMAAALIWGLATLAYEAWFFPREEEA